MASFQGTVSYTENSIIVNGKEIPVFSIKNPAELPWGKVGAEYVVESTGLFLSKDKAQGHIDAGAKHVIMSAPSKDDTPMFVMGVNNHKYNSDMTFVSNASCTTNCLAPIAKVLHDKWGITDGLMTTVHATTATQKTVDGPSQKDWRGGRGAAVQHHPQLHRRRQGRGQGHPRAERQADRHGVPRAHRRRVRRRPDRRALAKPAKYAEICAAMKEASEGELKGILGYTEDEVVSSDFIHDARTSIFDAKAGIALTDTFIKVVSWYDNEWGYSNKVVELIKYMSSSVDHPESCGCGCGCC